MSIVILRDHARRDGRRIRRLGARNFDSNDVAVAVALNRGHVTDDDAVVAAHFAAYYGVRKIFSSRHSGRGDR